MDSTLRASSSMIITPLKEQQEKKTVLDHPLGHPLSGQNDDDGIQFNPKVTGNGSLSRPGSPLNTGLLPWDRFNNWLYCMCVVTFDIEIGQAIETIYPHHVKLTEREVSYILGLLLVM